MEEISNESSKYLKLAYIFIKKTIALSLPRNHFHLKIEIPAFQNRFLLARADNASDNVITVWRVHYSNIQTIELISLNTVSFIKVILLMHNLQIMKLRISVEQIQYRLLAMYCLPKMQKKKEFKKSEDQVESPGFFL